MAAGAVDEDASGCWGGSAGVLNGFDDAGNPFSLTRSLPLTATVFGIAPNGLGPVFPNTDLRVKAEVAPKTLLTGPPRLEKAEATGAFVGATNVGAEGVAPKFSVNQPETLGFSGEATAGDRMS